MELKVEKNIPIPASRTGRGTGVAGTLRGLKVKESVFVPGKVQTDLSGSVSALSRKTGYKFTTRQESDGVRIWRVF